MPELDFLPKIFVGGGDHAHIGLQDLFAADTHELAGLQDPQQLRLDGRAGVGDFIKKKGAAVGQLENPPLPAHRSRESAPLVPE